MCPKGKVYKVVCVFCVGRPGQVRIDRPSLCVHGCAELSADDHYLRHSGQKTRPRDHWSESGRARSGRQAHSQRRGAAPPAPDTCLWPGRPRPGCQGSETAVILSLSPQPADLKADTIEISFDIFSFRIWIMIKLN